MPSKDPETRRRHWREYYHRNKERLVESKREYRESRRAGNRDLIREAKSQPCADCGNTFPPVCVDFDHVGEDKTADIATLSSSGYSQDRIREEIAKCEVVCSNCHRIRTAERFWND